WPLLFHASPARRYLPSFPTRRSSDLALACFMALAIAAMTVMVRRHKDTSMVAAAAMSNILGSVVSIPFAHGIAGITGFDLFILRSEEHTSELQSPDHLVCRHLPESTT